MYLLSSRHGPGGCPRPAQVSRIPRWPPAGPEVMRSADPHVRVRPPVEAARRSAAAARSVAARRPARPLVRACHVACCASTISRRRCVGSLILGTPLVTTSTSTVIDTSVFLEPRRRTQVVSCYPSVGGDGLPNPQVSVILITVPDVASDVGDDAAHAELCLPGQQQLAVWTFSDDELAPR